MVPVIVTEVPTGPELGAIPVTPNVTVKSTPLLVKPPPLETVTLPVLAAVGTGTVMLVSLQLVGDPSFEPKATTLVPCVAPKLVPVTVTEIPIGPEVGDTLVIAGVTTKLPELGTPPTVTTTFMFPGDTPAGTCATMLVSLQLVGVTAVPLKVTVLVPWVDPKLVPLIVTAVPTGP